MRTTLNKPEAESAASKPGNAKPPSIASVPIRDTLAALDVNVETGLTHAAVQARRKEHGFNEVAEKKGHPVFLFLGKFWGLSAWMLELIMALLADVVTGTVLTFAGLPGLMPLPGWQTLTIFAYAMVSCLVVNDVVNVAMIRWQIPTAAA